ncbi:MAG: hypothetical protein Kow006_01150 [Gammaproteobacteria bacterium]
MPAKNPGPYKQWSQCPCGFAGIMTFYRRSDDNYHDPELEHVVLHAECPSCGEWGRAMFTLDQLREMERG